MSVCEDLKWLLTVIIKRKMTEKDIEKLDIQAQEKGMTLAEYLESLFDMSRL